MITARIPLSKPKAEITEAMLHRLVHTFYARIRQDDALGPIFEKSIGHRWDEHLVIMVDFWSSIALSTGRYGGKPHLAHRDLGLSPGHFQHWLTLFEETARKVCPADAAAFFIDRAHRIADSLQINLDIGPKALRLPQSQPA